MTRQQPRQPQHVWAVCNCGRWNAAPTGFHELKHLLHCDSCGATAFPVHSHPKDAGYTPMAIGDFSLAPLTEAP